MTNYNDGKWHGWNGGECPVHPESVVEIVTSRYGVTQSRPSKYFNWWHKRCASPIVAFRVVKEHKEPREWDVVVHPANLNITYMPDTHRKCGLEVIRVKEVLESD